MGVASAPAGTCAKSQRRARVHYEGGATAAPEKHYRGTRWSRASVAQVSTRARLGDMRCASFACTGTSRPYRAYRLSRPHASSRRHRGSGGSCPLCVRVYACSLSRRRFHSCTRSQLGAVSEETGGHKNQRSPQVLRMPSHLEGTVPVQVIQTAAHPTALTPLSTGGRHPPTAAQGQVLHGVLQLEQRVHDQGK